MKKILAILFLFPLLVLGQFEVNGSVKNSKGEPIQEAIINLDGYPQQIKTDSLGKFSIKDIPQGKYITTIFSFNYQPQTDTLKIGFDNQKKYTFHYELKAISYSANTVEIGHDDYDFGLGRVPLIDGTSIYGPKNLTLINMDHNDGNKSAGNARELFAKLPGINIWESDGGGIQVGIGTRGLSPNRTANFNTRQNGYDISADALGYPESYYSPPFEALEQIEIVKGAASLQYGTQFGGLLNFKIKRPSEKQIEFTTRNTYGAYNFFNTFNRISGTAKRFYYQAYYQYKRGDGWRENSGFQQHQAFAKFAAYFDNRKQPIPCSQSLAW